MPVAVYEGGPDRWVYGVLIACSTVAFAIVFVASWLLSKLLFPNVFPMLETYKKADWASRVGSTLHSLIVVPGFIATMASTRWDNYWPVDEDQAAVTATRVIMCISMGYFAVDFLVILVYRVPLWIVFVVHHIVACIPFYIHLFDLKCRAATFVLEGFLLVELANVFMNLLCWLDMAGQVRTKLHTVVFYCNYAVWFPSRLGIPVLMMTIIYKFIFFDKQRLPNNKCLIPGMVCCHIISAFCYTVFLAFLTPDVVRRWRNPAAIESQIERVEQKRRGRGIDTSGIFSNEPFDTEAAAAEANGSAGPSTPARSPQRGSPRGSGRATPMNLPEVATFVSETLREMVPDHAGSANGNLERGVSVNHEDTLSTVPAFRD